MRRGFFLFLIGALGYCGIELLSRGYTHWSMGVTGGFCFIAIDWIYRSLTNVWLWLRAAAAALAVTAAELCAGLIVNIWLGLNVWSYAHEPLNFLGQICMKYTFIWFLLCYILMLGFKTIVTEIAKRKRVSE